MKNSFYSSILAHLLIWCMTLSSIPIRADTVEVPVAPRLMTVILQDIQIRNKNIVEGKIRALLASMDSKNSAQAAKELGQLADDIQSGKTSIETAKELMIQHNVTNAKEMKRLLLNQFKSLNSKKLAVFEEVLAKNPSYKRFSEKMKMVYTQTEKISILKEALFQDLDQALLASMKKIHWLNKDGIVDDLKAVQLQYVNSKGDGHKILRMLLVGAAVIVAAGLISYGIANSSYKSQFKAKEKVEKDAYDTKSSTYAAQLADLKSQLLAQRNALNSQLQGQYNQQNAQLQAQYNQLVSDLQDQLTNLNNTLTAQEQQYLQDNGFVRMVCNSYTVQNSTVCNGYNYQLISGSSVCTVMCMKNISTGKETLHELPTCASPFIPADCFSSAVYYQEWYAGYNVGYSSGNTSGQNQGSIDGDTNGNKDGKNDGNTDGYYDGYNNGYFSAYNNAYNSSYNRGDSDGYYDGYDAGFVDRYSTGYEDGYNTGYNDAYNGGYNSGYTDGYYDGYDVGISSGAKVSSQAKLSSSTFTQGYIDGMHDARVVQNN